MGNTKKNVGRGFRIFLLVMLAATLVLFFTTKTVVVRGESMYPTFKDGRRLLTSEAYWAIGPLKHNDIVVVREFAPNRKGGYFIKRVKYLPGDRVNRAFWPRSFSMRNAEYVVPENMLFLLGDNREVSEDSRIFGPIDRSLVIGKVIVWP